MAFSERDILIFESVTQRYYKELVEYIWAWVGTIASFSVVAGGIYFSQVAFAAVLGNTDVMITLSYGIALMISGLEVQGITLLGNKNRSSDIKNSNAWEHKIMTGFTWLLFAFDIMSNVYGLWITALAFSGKINFISFVFIILLSALMGGGEIIVGWMIRGLAVHRAQYFTAKVVYDKFNERVQNELGDGEIKPNKSDYRDNGFTQPIQKYGGK